MNIDDIRLLYDFNAWANHRTMEACAALAPEQFTRDIVSSFRSVRGTLAHIYSAQWAWLERWHGRTPTGPPPTADFPDFETARRRFVEIDRNLVDFAASLNADDLHRMVQYKSVAGVAQSQPLWQMLQHVANHGTYHRGQVTTLLRQLGAEATSTDLIAFYRERAAQANA